MSRQGRSGRTRTYTGTDQGIAGMTLIGGIDETLTPAGIMILTTLLMLLKKNSTSSMRKQVRKRPGRERSGRGRIG